MSEEQNQQFKNEFEGKDILITGGTGSIGSELAYQLLKFNPRQIRILSRDESKQYELLERLGRPANVRILIGDIRDKERIDFAFRGIDIVFHAAALKHVSLCEYNPFEAIKTNILGSQNVIDVALKNDVKKVIAISTDKAVYPSNIMGVSKLLMEKLFVNANYYSGKSNTRFACVRFGNVAWARGSVLPLWKKQVETDKKIQVTNPEMTRFLMSPDQAINLVLSAATFSQAGEIFVLKMPSVALGDLAKLFIEKYHAHDGIAIEHIGARAGDKLHEQLIDDNDRVSRMYENDSMYIFVPLINITNLEQEFADYPGFKRIDSVDTYHSSKFLDNERIKDII